MKFTPREVRRIKGGRKFHYSKILISLQKIASSLLVFTFLPMSFVVLPESTLIQAKADDDYVNHVALSINDADIVETNRAISTITVGESNYNKELRLKAEDEARAKAEAEKQLTEKRKVVSRDGRGSSCSDFDDVFQRASNTYGVEPKLLKAIHKIETNCSGSTDRKSWAGATGPMQFMPSTWRKVGVDGNSDGLADINNIEDAIFSAANYLVISGYPNTKKSLWSYNPSERYYRKVISVMSSF